MSQFRYAWTSALGLICFVLLAGADEGNSGQKVELTAEPSLAEGPAIQLAGIVTSPVGRPIGGAKLVLRAAIGGQQYTSGLRHNRDVLARTTTDREGRFDFGRVPIPPRFAEQIEQLTRGAGGVEVLAWAEGYGLVWMDVPQLDNEKPVKGG